MGRDSSSASGGEAVCSGQSPGGWGWPGTPFAQPCTVTTLRSTIEHHDRRVSIPLTIASPRLWPSSLRSAPSASSEILRAGRLQGWLDHPARPICAPSVRSRCRPFSAPSIDRVPSVNWTGRACLIPSRHPPATCCPVWALILTLGYSRLLSVVFSFGTKMPEFLQAHAQLLAFIGGVPHTLVYDNMSSVVIEPSGQGGDLQPPVPGLCRALWLQARMPAHPANRTRKASSSVPSAT